MQCQLCQRVARALHPSSGYRISRFYNTSGRIFVHLGSWQEIQENQNCSTCLRIANLFNSEFEKTACDPNLTEYSFWLDDWASTFLRLGLASASHVFWPTFTIYPLSEGSSEHVGVVLDPNWVDLERIRKWVKSCDIAHGKCLCQFLDPGTLFPTRHMYLISVAQNCLIKANGCEKYVALSYVWGAGVRQFRTSRATLDFLQSKGSISNTKVRDKLPETITRAMHLISLLGLDLLWVDTLCIVEDDPVHTAAQIDSMASIFSNSYLTLCAADGIDATSGLLGVPECSQPRSIQQDILAFTDGLITSRWVQWMDGDSVYCQRGWTFQEQMLSRRTLSFTDHGLEWRCQEVVSQEQNLDRKKPMNPYLHLNIMRADTLWPCLKKWDNLVSSYLERRLTYEEDILRAFSGILAALDGSMEGFHFGLPQQFFDVALLWVPRERLTRREELGNKVTRPKLPSWSWAGWKGARENQVNGFGLGHERSNFISDYKPRLRDIFPCVTWFKIDMDTREEAEIPNSYAKHQSEGLEGTVSLPLGGSSHLNENGGPFYYTYDEAPPSQSFWYPIPIDRSIKPAIKRQWGSILRFKTWRGYLQMGSALSQQANKKTYPLHSVTTEEGEWAGVLYVHEHPEGTGRCELVLISGGFARETEDDKHSGWIPEWTCAERPRSGNNYLFYHVLWIEWQDGIAYRKGLGRIVQGIWDDLSKDEVEIYLG